MEQKDKAENEIELTEEQMKEVSGGASSGEQAPKYDETGRRIHYAGI